MSFKKTFFPTEFIEKYKPMLGSEWEAFYEAIQHKRPKSFWVNTKKATINEIKSSLTSKGIRFEQYPFHEQAFSINLEKPSELIEYQQGKISLQEKASMLPVVALSPQKSDSVFDTCSSPGMKTIQLSNLSQKVLATDVHSKRISILLETKNKFALENVEVKRIDFRNIKKNKRFDKVLLDAPCSSEGVVRKKREALLEWSQKLVLRKAEEQKHMIVRAFDYLKEGREMVYSTCSFAPEENEEVVLHLLSKRSAAQVVKVDLPGIKIRKNDLCENCVRLYPQDNDTQQFFLAKIKKV